MIDARACLGTHDILLLTLDSLRFDVATRALQQGLTPNLARLLPQTGWERRHSPGNFTYAAHQAFFAGFLPTPVTPGKHPRLFALEFPGSETIAPETCVFSSDNIVTGLAAQGYHTLCIGGVGFFNKQSPLGNALPGLFQENHWYPSFGVTDRHSTRHQVDFTLERLQQLPDAQRLFLFLNVSATHQPSCIFKEGALADSVETQMAALAYADAQLSPLITALHQRAPLLCIICSDHGTTFGEDGYQGHRLAHPLVWDVPYLECLLPQTGGPA